MQSAVLHAAVLDRPTREGWLCLFVRSRFAAVDVRIVERRYVPNVASSGAVIRSASAATTIRGRVRKPVQPERYLPVRTEPADGWSRSTLPFIAPGSLCPFCKMAGIETNLITDFERWDAVSPSHSSPSRYSCDLAPTGFTVRRSET